jgi:S-methylmethionine-dependent homocysteine/selenocysteine methylase
MFLTALNSNNLILTEGSIIEKISRKKTIELDPFILNTSLVTYQEGRKVLSNIYREYLNIGKKHDIPMITFAPTWRANPERLELAGFNPNCELNHQAVEFMQNIRNEFSDYADKIFIGGLMACKGDAYDPSEALTEPEALIFHSTQAKVLAESGVDFIMAATMPEIGESIGMAKAIGQTNIPYTISFVIRPSGTLLDGTPIHEAIELIDKSVDPKPTFYMANCIHPSVFGMAMEAENDHLNLIKSRLVGLQANTSARSPEELNNLEYLDTEEPSVFADTMVKTANQFDLKIVGGCCGTDERHIEAIAERVKPL